MSRRIVYQLLIALGIVLLFASITYWLDLNTSEKPVGLGQNILGWATVVADILTWLAAYLVREKNKSDNATVQPSRQIYINGNVINSNLNIGDNSELIISKDKNGNTNYRESISNAHLYLEGIKNEFDKENINLAGKLLGKVKEIVLKLDNENLSLEYEILECRWLQKNEQIDEAKERYESVSKRFPKDSRALLYLAEIYLNDNNFDKNKELLEKAQGIDGDYWLLKLELVLRQSSLRERVERENIDEETFPNDVKIKASFYRVYGLILEDLGDQQKADTFIEKAIYLHPDRFSNHVAKLALAEVRMLSTQDDSRKSQLSQDLLKEIEKVEEKFLKDGDVGARNRAILNSNKLIAFLVQENIPGFENLSKETFELLLTCYFDKQVERILIGVLRYSLLLDDDLNRLLGYLKNSTNDISDDLAKVLVDQLNFNNKLFTDGKKFFREIGSQKFLEFIDALEGKNDEKVIAFLKQDIGFAIAFTNTLKGFPDLRRKIIEDLPDDGRVQKEKLKLLLDFDEQNYDEAFNVLRELDLSQLSYIECRPMLGIAQQKGAWDFEIVILIKLLEKERDRKEVLNLKAQLFNAYLNSKKFLDAITVGEQLLKDDSAERFFNPQNQQALLANTIYALKEVRLMKKHSRKLNYYLKSIPWKIYLLNIRLVSKLRYI